MTREGGAFLRHNTHETPPRNGETESLDLIREADQRWKFLLASIPSRPVPSNTSMLSQMFDELGNVEQ